MNEPGIIGREGEIHPFIEDRSQRPLPQVPGRLFESGQAIVPGLQAGKWKEDERDKEMQESRGIFHELETIKGWESMNSNRLLGNPSMCRSLRCRRSSRGEGAKGILRSGRRVDDEMRDMNPFTVDL
jgi:hypothetical protein